jgi:hypothetical protein
MFAAPFPEPTTRAVNGKLPRAVVSIPLIAPLAGFNDKPGGRDPDVIEKT